MWGFPGVDAIEINLNVCVRGAGGGGGGGFPGVVALKYKCKYICGVLTWQRAMKSLPHRKQVDSSTVR